MLEQLSSARPGVSITVSDAPCITDADARRTAIDRIARQRPPLTDAQRRRLRPFTAAGIPAPMAAS